ncbi:hypothetical protein O3P69_019446 [Scylla paramamosain]|uniref:Uncharacterized protein n=1 Tax=Scylla paramamosain TaxID=85552 RepID=A0AAW0SXV5_SCYPA
MAATTASSPNNEDKRPVTSKPNPPRLSEPTWECVADKLLREKLLLTGLELYLELEERGRDLPSSLKEFFSNPINFESRCANEGPSSSLPGPGLLRSSSQTTLDSLDWGRLSEDGERAGEERIAVLEFELRKAKETIQGLRATLTTATERQLTTTTTASLAPTPPRAGLGGGWGAGQQAGEAGRGREVHPRPP